ncbi:MAG: WD40 repeat domain-containing protein [Treponema sp.]|nr:WD40 repeat domain-containing protein [Treponema sp.]
MTHTLCKKIAATVIASLPFFSVGAQSHISTQAHQSSVTSIVPATDDYSLKTFFSADNDGFLIKWMNDDQGEHYQISDLQIKLIAASPDGKTVAAYETDGGVTNRVSVWDFNTLKRKYARRFSDPLTSLSFSAKGTYIIAGTTAVDSAIFLRTSDGAVVNKVKDATGIISYAATSSTEKTVCMYSPMGTISYYDMQTGRLRQKLQTESNLLHIVTFNNDTYMAGVKNNNVYIISALTGKIATVAAAKNPILLTSRNDTNVYYFAENAARGFSLYALEFGYTKSFSTPQILKNYKSLGNEKIVAGTKYESTILLGSNGGNIYRTDATPETETLSLHALTDNIYEKIYDMANAPSGFYFLTKDAIYQSSYDTGIVNKLAQNPAHTHMATYGNGILLWSKGTKRDVQFLDFSTQQLKNLFTPKNSIQMLRVFRSIALDIENDTNVNAYHLDTGKREELYIGAGLQDAVLIDDILYVAKSSATNPPAALISVNVNTKEVVPLKVNGNVIYSLSSVGEMIYGITVQSGEAKMTNLFSFMTRTLRSATLLKLNDEDTNAFTYFHDGTVYTDIGGDKVFGYSVSTRKNVQYNRSASLPLKVAQNGNHVVILNKDGSVSWYNVEKANVLADWYLTRDGAWFEF